MQQRNNYQAVEQFLDDESFRRWVLEGENSHNWEEWTLENPQRAKLVEEAREWLLAIQVPEEIVYDQEVQVALQHTWNKIRATEESSAPTQSLARRFRGWWVAASVLLVGAVLGWIYLTPVGSGPPTRPEAASLAQQTDLIEKRNTTSRPLLIMLADGSSVLLQPNSTLRYPSEFARTARKVYLIGDGFFEVSKNHDMPFYVYANEVVTRVVGTSFRIRAYANQKNVEVVVRTGKVNVTSSHTEKEEILLLPNQGVRFVRQNLVFEKIEDLTQEKQFSQELSNIEKLSFEFTDVPVAQIFRTIEQAYLVKVDFPAEKLADCYLTTSLSDQPLSEKLKIICESLGGRTSYDMTEDRITIQTNGCN